MSVLRSFKDFLGFRLYFYGKYNCFLRHRLNLLDPWGLNSTSPAAELHFFSSEASCVASSIKRENAYFECFNVSSGSHDFF